MRRQAVITGLGIVSPIGVGVDRFWHSACAGKSGIGHPTLFDASNLPRECQIVGEVKDFDPRDWMPAAAARMAGRFSQFAVAAAKMALADSGLDLKQLSAERVMVFIGTSMSGLVDVQEPNFEAFLRGDELASWTALEYPGHAAASHVAINLGARGQISSLASACTAGADAIACAAAKIHANEATVVLAGGTDTPLSGATLQAFRSLGALSKWRGPVTGASRPFEKFRSGLVLAEGAAVVIVEDEDHARSRGASIYARIAGVGSVTEGEHMRNLDPQGTSTAKAMSIALRCSELAPSDIDYICAHGNSLLDYDAAETAGIKRVLGRHAWSCPVSSIKSMCGQSLAAGGAMQVVATCLAIRHEIVPPTINYSEADPACDLDYVPNIARVARIRHALIHAQSIGGSHAALVLSSWS